MLRQASHRPRNVDAPRAAALLYGDWGSSKAYVIGLALAVAGYMSFWLILAVSVLSLFVGMNYVIICKYFPHGGGVYASARRRSKILSIVGALFLVADFLVTAALSALSAFYYFGVADPVYYAALFIVLLGIFNYFGPRHTGTVASYIVIAAVICFTLLALVSLPFLKEAWQNIEPLRGEPLSLWAKFCSIIVALSGVETIANTTGVMKLNKGTTIDNPKVTRTSTSAIFFVMLEVVIYTTLFGFAAAAIGNFQFSADNVWIPGYPDVRDYLLRYLGMIFGTSLFGPTIGNLFSLVISIVVGFILLSAANTAMHGLITLQYLMASDEELPHHFRRINKYGVPLLPLLVTTLIPLVLIVSMRSVFHLAGLYAIGFVGAIAMNLGCTSTDLRLPLKKQERLFMFLVFLMMAAIEITLFIDREPARYFAILVMLIGLGFRLLAKRLAKKAPPPEIPREEMWKNALLCAIKRPSKALKKAIEASNHQKIPLNVLLIKEQRVISEKDLLRSGERDFLTKKVLGYIAEHGDPKLVHFHYCMTDSFADIAIAYAIRFEASQLFVDCPRRPWLTLIRGSDLPYLQQHLPSNIRLRIIPY